jgi:hypothetical protein
MVILVGTGLNRMPFPYFWDQLTASTGVLVHHVPGRGRR